MYRFEREQLRREGAGVWQTTSWTTIRRDDVLLSVPAESPRFAVSAWRACFRSPTDCLQEQTINTNQRAHPTAHPHEENLLERLPDLLLANWRLFATSVAPLGGGMNSFTALVVADHHRWVAKWVRAADSAGLRQGAQIAARLAAKGMRSGRPLPTMHGELMTALGGGSVVLLEHVPGRELTGEVRDQPDLAGALARAHALLGPSEPDAGFMSWLGDDQRVGDVAAWVLPAIEVVLAEFRGLPSVTWGTLHADPSPEAFILDETTGEVGIIDWSAACAGPLMYDVASAVMYLGGPANARTFLEHYASGGPLTDC